MPLEPIEDEVDDDEVVEKSERKKETAKPAKLNTNLETNNRPLELNNLVSNERMMTEPMELGKMRMAEGGSVAFGGVKYTAYAKEEEPVVNVKHQLTLVKGGGISVKINKPAKFEEVKTIADELLEKYAVIVNYELVDTAEQQRIGDFINGVCYATDGRVEQISERIMLYMPEGMDAESVISGYARR